jgi:hypothetical protein
MSCFFSNKSSGTVPKGTPQSYFTPDIALQNFKLSLKLTDLVYLCTISPKFPRLTNIEKRCSLSAHEKLHYDSLATTYSSILFPHRGTSVGGQRALTQLSNEDVR